MELVFYIVPGTVSPSTPGGNLPLNSLFLFLIMLMLYTWMPPPTTNFLPLNTAYNKLCKFVPGCPSITHHCSMYNSFNWSSLETRRHLHWLQLTFKCIHLDYPHYLKQYLVQYSSRYQLRLLAKFYFTVPSLRKQIGKRAFRFVAPSHWNKLPPHIRSLTSFHLFKNSVSSHFKLNNSDLCIYFTNYCYCYLSYLFCDTCIVDVPCTVLSLL